MDAVKKKKVVLSVTAVLVVCLLIALGVGLGSCHPDFYSTEQHIKRINRLVQKRFIDTGLHKSYKLYPLYNRNDEITNFLIEFDSDGYLYVKLTFKLIYGHDMYICNYDTEYMEWY